MPNPETEPERRAEVTWTPTGTAGLVGAILFVLVSLWLVATAPQGREAAAHAVARPAAGGAAGVRP